MLGLILFFFNDTATTEIYTLSLHDALPISPAARRTPARLRARSRRAAAACARRARGSRGSPRPAGDRKSTRLNSSHLVISYAVFCLKKKKSSETAAHPASPPLTSAITHPTV